MILFFFLCVCVYVFAFFKMFWVLCFGRGRLFFVSLLLLSCWVFFLLFVSFLVGFVFFCVSGDLMGSQALSIASYH